MSRSVHHHINIELVTCILYIKIEFFRLQFVNFEALTNWTKFRAHAFTLILHSELNMSMESNMVEIAQQKGSRVHRVVVGCAISEACESEHHLYAK